MKHFRKRLLTGAATALCLMALTITAGAEGVLCGDANGDSSVDMKDVLTVRKYVAGMSVDIDLAAADTDGDGSVDMKDVLVVRKFVAKLIDTMPAMTTTEWLLSKIVWHNADGSVRNWTESTYDESGNCTSKRRYNADGSVDWEYSWDAIYDENGNRTSKRWYNADGSVDWDNSDTWDATYDENGNQTSYREYNADGSVVWDYENTWGDATYDATYDESGNQTSRRHYNADGSVRNWYEYEYIALTK